MLAGRAALGFFPFGKGNLGVFLDFPLWDVARDELVASGICPWE